VHSKDFSSKSRRTFEYRSRPNQRALTLRGLPKRAFEYLYGLAALNEILVVQNHSWHCVNASILIKLLARPNLSRELVGIEYLTGAFPVQSHACCKRHEYLVDGWI